MLFHYHRSLSCGWQAFSILLVSFWTSSFAEIQRSRKLSGKADNVRRSYNNLAIAWSDSNYYLAAHYRIVTIHVPCSHTPMSASLTSGCAKRQCKPLDAANMVVLQGTRKTLKSIFSIPLIKTNLNIKNRLNPAHFVKTIKLLSFNGALL